MGFHRDPLLEENSKFMSIHVRHRIAFSSAFVLVACLGLATACGDSSTTPTSDAGPGPGLDASATPTSDASDASADLTPFTIGVGYKPGLGIDASGTAYIAWYGSEPTTNTLQFCRLPRGAGACDIRMAIAAPGTTLTRPFVTVSGSTVRVISYRYGLTGGPFDAVYAFTSTDGGATFDAGRQIGTTPYSDAAMGPGDTISFATDAYTFGEVFENTAVTATAPPAQRAILSADHPYSGTVGFVDAATPLVAFANGSSNAQFRRYSGTGDLNDVASWSPAQELGYGAYMHLASGPAGLFLKATNQDGKLEVRRFDGTTFAAGVNVSCSPSARRSPTGSATGGCAGRR